MNIAQVPASVFDEKPRRTGHYVIIVTPLTGDRPYVARNIAGKVLKYIDSVDALVEADIIRRTSMSAVDIQYKGGR